MANADYIIENGVLKKYHGSGGRISIPECVTSVADYAFYGKSSNLVFKTFDNGKYLGNESNPYQILYSIKKTATSCTIHPDTRVIMYRAAQTCRDLRSVIVPDGVKSIGQCAFEQCSNLTSIIIPESVSQIDGSAFSRCLKLSSIRIPNGVHKIESYTFSYCLELKSITIPKNVNAIAPSAFFTCPALAEITVAFDNPVFHSIGNCIINTKERKLVLGCKTSVIPSDGSVEIIDSYAFRGCRDLLSITIPKSVSLIEDMAFGDCRGLTTIIVDPDNSIYHSERNCLIDTENRTLVAGCKKSIIPGDGHVLHIARGAFQGCDELFSLLIPNGVKSIGQYAFSNCKCLKSVFIPDSVNSIDDSSFSNCGNLTLFGYGVAWEYADKHNLKFQYGDAWVDNKV